MTRRRKDVSYAEGPEVLAYQAGLAGKPWSEELPVDAWARGVWQRHARLQHDQPTVGAWRLRQQEQAERRRRHQ